MLFVEIELSCWLNLCFVILVSPIFIIFLSVFIYTFNFFITHLFPIFLFKVELAINFQHHSILLTLLSLGEIIFAPGRFKFKLFLNDLWYEPETLWIFLTFNRDYFAAEKITKNIKLLGGNIFLYRGYCQKIGLRIFRNIFSWRIKYLHV